MSQNSTEEIKKEFGNQAKKYRFHYGLSQGDIAELAKLSASEYSEIESGKRNYNVERLEQVSNVYGVKYYILGNPKADFPSFKSLPDETKKHIKDRKQKGSIIINRNNDLNLPNHINDVLASGKIKIEFTSAEVYKELPAAIQKEIEPNRITDLFKKGALKNKVDDTGKRVKEPGKKGRGQVVYRLKN